MRPDLIPALILALLPGLAAAEPTYHRVTGVAPDDTLNVRAAPSADSADVGDLAHDQRGIEVSGLDPTGKWARIVWQESNGWIATRFLTSDPVPRLGASGVPQGLTCGGTEPFWALDLTSSTVRYSDAMAADYDMALTGVSVAEGRLGSPAVVGFSGPFASGDAILAPDICSDGMSDRDYPWRIDLLLSSGGTRRFVSGCCRLPLD